MYTKHSGNPFMNVTWWIDFTDNDLPDSRSSGDILVYMTPSVSQSGDIIILSCLRPNKDEVYNFGNLDFIGGIGVSPCGCI
jgi:hypothetical protein